MNAKQRSVGGVTSILVFVRISDAILSSVTIVLIALSLGTCVFYALALLFGGFEGNIRKAVYFLVAIVLIRFLSPIMVQATSEEGLERLKRNRAFELALLLVKITRNCFAIIVLFRLALFASVLFGDNGVSQGFRALWHILRQVVLGKA